MSSPEVSEADASKDLPPQVEETGGRKPRIPRRRPLHPAWIVAAVAFLALVGAGGLRAAPRGGLVARKRELGGGTTQG